jgi:50S ribosomal subunit-associated GTPase HflX
MLKIGLPESSLFTIDYAWAETAGVDMIVQESDLLVHLIDISNPFFEEHIEAVERILMELDLNHIPRLLVFNKEDRVRREEARALARHMRAITPFRASTESLRPLFDAIEKRWCGKSVFHSDPARDQGAVEDRPGHPGNPFQTR